MPDEVAMGVGFPNLNLGCRSGSTPYLFSTGQNCLGWYRHGKWRGANTCERCFAQLNMLGAVVMVLVFKIQISGRMGPLLLLSLGNAIFALVISPWEAGRQNYFLDVFGTIHICRSQPTTFWCSKIEF